MRRRQQALQRCECASLAQPAHRCSLPPPSLLAADGLVGLGALPDDALARVTLAVSIGR